HITWMLGIARIMVSMKNEWKGTLVFVAQPAEELGQGAKAMIDDRMYEKGIPVPDYLLGMHTWPIPVGTIQNGFGDRFAGTDQLDVTFYGIGGHGSSPDLTKDPIVMASTAIMQYQTIISRNIAPQDAAVITVGSFQAGTANNIIPASALLKMNLRWFSDKSRNILLDGIKRVNEGIAIANNLPKELFPVMTMKATASPLVNNEAMVKKVNAALAKTMDLADIITTSPALMVSEDFHYLAAPGSKTVYDYLMIGVANDEVFRKATKAGMKYPYFNHNGNYQVDLSAIPIGTRVGANALLGLFKAG
ncbi:MAG: amidohydrolase, partial [Chitinophagaceae bacterium]